MAAVAGGTRGSAVSGTVSGVHMGGATVSGTMANAVSSRRPALVPASSAPHRGTHPISTHTIIRSIRKRTEFSTLDLILSSTPLTLS